jgi:hypothetical protein
MTNIFQLNLTAFILSHLGMKLTAKGLEVAIHCYNPMPESSA